jgi:alkaline phosphatase
VHRALAALAVAWLLAAAPPAGATPRNVILLIGDGMGNGHVDAARAWAGEPLRFEAAPHQAQMTTDSATTGQNGQPTDSAAAATALSTGVKVHNTVISVAFPGDLSELETLVEVFNAQGKASGLVTTSYLTDATPAAFAAHALLRFESGRIVEDYLTQTRPEVMLGGGGNGFEPSAAEAAGYTVVHDRAGLAALDPAADGPVVGLFGIGEGMPYEWDHAEGVDPGYDTLPFLHEMTGAALSFLEDDPDGFFLLVEQENTDRAGHSTGDGPERIGRNVFATLELVEALDVVLTWAAGRDDTLVIVTADHETGGLQVLADNGPGELPTVSWAGSDHTGATVPVYALGPNAELVDGVIDNTEIRHVVTAPEAGALPLGSAALLALAVRLPRTSGAGARRSGRRTRSRSR